VRRLTAFVAIRPFTPDGRQALRSRLTIRRYTGMVAAGLLGTAAQAVLLPSVLPARSFGLIVLAISATQGMLVLGDLGISRLAVSSTLTSAQRTVTLQEGQAVALVVGCFALLALAAIWIVVPHSREVVQVLFLGLVAGWLAIADKYRAAGREAAGDEVAAATYNFMWTNVPKYAQLVALVAFRDPTTMLASAALIGAIIQRPRVVSPRVAWPALLRYREWAGPITAIASSFVVTWSDTYFLSFRLGLAGGGAYQVLYRVFALSQYFYQPWGSVIVARVNARVHRPVVRPVLIAVGLTMVWTLAAGVAISPISHIVFRHYVLPIQATPVLVVVNIIAAMSYCYGSALYASGWTKIGAVANGLAAATALTGHIVFTLHGNAVTGATVSASAMAVGTLVQLVAYTAATRTGRVRAEINPISRAPGSSESIADAPPRL